MIIQVPKFSADEFFKKRSEYCLCIPVINEGNKIRKVIRSLKKYSETVDTLILDGGSTDGSLEKSFLKNNRVSSLLTLKEQGRLSSQLRMGYYFAIKRGYKGILTIDGNGKDDPASIPLFIKALSEGYDYVQGSRFIKGGKGINTPIIRYLAIRLLHAPILSLASGFLYTDTTPGFRGYSRRLLKSDRLHVFRNIFYSYELLAYITARAPRLGFRAKEISIKRSYPKTGAIPTKIHGLKGEIQLFLTLIKASLGFFNP